MSEWKEVILKDVCSDIAYGYTASATSENTGIKFLRITDISNKPLNWSSVPFCLISEKDSQKYKLDIGDIVIARTGATTGVTYTFKEDIPAVFASYLIRYRINPEVANPFFVGHILQSSIWSAFVESIAGGSAQPGANAQQLASFEFSLPTLPEQQAIAEVLSSLDDKIDLLHRNNKTLEAIVEAFFRQWFVEEAKEDWEEGELGSLFDIGIGRTPPRAEKEWFTTNNTDIKWVSIKDMGSSGLYISNTSEYLTNEAVERFNIPVIPTNTVLLSFKMTIGRLAITTEEMLSNEAIAHFKIKADTSLFPEFLYLYLKTYRWEQLGSTSSIVEAINSKMIKEMLMVVPPADILGDFEELVRPYFDKIKLNQSQINNLVSLRNELLAKLMSGEVGVNQN